MEPRRITRPILRGAAAALVGLTAVLAACEAKVPTAGDISRMDAASAERQVKRFVGDTAEIWFVDGKRTTALAAKAIPADSIATVNVTGISGTEPVKMNIRTKPRGADAGEQTVSPAIIMRPSHENGAAVELRTTPGMDQPLLIIDGKRSGLSALKSIDRAKIQSVEVLKGPDAIQAYGADAGNGVIVVRTKS